jgi:hypothetical protein
LRGKFKRPLERQSFVNKLRGKVRRPLERQFLLINWEVSLEDILKDNSL